MYQFSVFSFSDTEIEQIITLVKSWTNGAILPVKRTTLTKKVIQYAIGWKLLEEREGKLYFPQYSVFNPVYDLPIEALWRMVAPMVRTEGQTGYSIVNNPGWDMLNIYPQMSRHASDRDLEAKIDALLKLSQYHYIHFQMAGTTWCIYREKEAA